MQRAPDRDPRGPLDERREETEVLINLGVERTFP
jgi:hypothetical protein